MEERTGILAIGNVLVDRTLVVPAYPAESMLTTISTLERHCGGGCTNVLFNLARLDPAMPRYLAGAVGNDDDGRFILAQAAAHGINTDAVITTAQPTSFTDVMISRDNGSRTFFHYLGAMADYGAAHVLAAKHPAKIAHFAYLPLLPALLPDWIPTLQALRAQGFLLCADLVSLPDKALFAQHIRPALPWLDYLIINDVEAALLLGEDGGDGRDALLRMAGELLALGVRDSVIVHSSRWAAAHNCRGDSAALPAYALPTQDIVSTLGAGDAFCTGALYGLHEARPLAEVLKLGHALARFNLFSLSATDGAVSYATLMQFIDTVAGENHVSRH